MQPIFWSIEKQNEFTENVLSLPLHEIRKGFIDTYHAFKRQEKQDGQSVSQVSRELFMKSSIYFQALPIDEQPVYRNIASESWMKQNNLQPIIRNR